MKFISVTEGRNFFPICFVIITSTVLGAQYSESGTIQLPTKGVAGEKDLSPLIDHNCSSKLWTLIIKRGVSGNIVAEESSVKFGIFSSSAPNDEIEWIQVDFGKVVYVSDIVFAGTTSIKWPQFPGISEFEILYKTIDFDPSFTELSRKILIADNTNGDMHFSIGDVIQLQIIRLRKILWSKSRSMLSIKFNILGCDLLDNSSSGCGGPRVYTNSGGFIASMNYPQKYSNNANCQWFIIAPEKQVVVFEFENIFAIEKGSGCMMEYVEMIDVIDGREISIGRQCGFQNPGKYSSIGNVMKVQFKTDHYETYEGFRARYKFVNSSGCGGPQSLVQKSGSFSFSSGNSGNQDECNWDVIVPAEMIIELFIIETSPKHNEDLENPFPIYITEVNNDHVIPTKVYLGKPLSHISQGSKLSIKIANTSYLDDIEFKVEYHAVEPSGCGGAKNVHQPSGKLHSINFPKSYETNVKCAWNIKSSADEIIELTFDHFVLEEGRDCQYDYVAIYAGPTEQQLIGKYCGSKKFSSSIISKTGMIRVIFVSDTVNVKSGFNATYFIRRAKRSMKSTPATSIQSITNVTIYHMLTSKSAYLTSIPIPGSTFYTTAIRERSSISVTMPYSKTATTVQEISTTPEGNNPNSRDTVSTNKEIVKWIVISLASLSGLLILLVLVGILYCCRQARKQRYRERLKSKTDHLSLTQNYAYDLSFGSTNHSIRSKQADQQESSQMSESISYQGTLRRCASRDSHIYFSIEEYSKRNKESVDEQPIKKNEIQNLKVHFHPGRNVARNEDSGLVEQSVPCNPDDANRIGETMSEEIGTRGEILEEKKDVDGKNLDSCKSCEIEQKTLVDNILYISTNTFD